ncbi:MAG: HU family DNA-binding protein [Armatimonadetes bacterium]|nr:HU family DNA-binding protein [Armatimonadota bacterium]
MSQAVRIPKKELALRLARRMETDEATALAWLDGVTETLYEAFKAGESVTLPGFGSFYLREERQSMVFKFSPAQRFRALFGWSSTYKGDL